MAHLLLSKQFCTQMQFKTFVIFKYISNNLMKISYKVWYIRFSLTGGRGRDKVLMSYLVH